MQQSSGGCVRGAKSPPRVQSNRILKLSKKFQNPHSVAKRLFRHAGAAISRPLPIRAHMKCAPTPETEVRCTVGRHALMPPLLPGRFAVGSMRTSTPTGCTQNRTAPVGAAISRPPVRDGCVHWIRYFSKLIIYILYIYIYYNKYCIHVLKSPQTLGNTGLAP